MKTLMIRGAYGRESNRKDWDSGKDFRICGATDEKGYIITWCGGSYLSNRDIDEIKAQGFQRIMCLYLNNYNGTAPIAFKIELV